MYALIDYKGKQYKAEKGATIQLDKLDIAEGEKLTIDTVVFVNNDGNVNIGAPYVSGASVVVKVENTFKDKKIIVYKYKSKKDYHRTIGHRQQYTNVIVEEIIVA
ncbi:MAG: 50S ribosomal protein L21 [Treponemataceae bacterium]